MGRIWWQPLLIKNMKKLKRLREECAESAGRISMDQKTLLGSFPAWQHMYVLVQWNCWPVARNRRKMWPGSFGSTGFFDSKIHRRQQVTRWVMEADCSFWKLAVRCVLRLAGSLGWTDEILDSATNWSIDPFVCIITCHDYCLTFLIQNTLVYCVSNN